ncbi:TetR/AcrR family transcriptional regulator [Streptomyces sp. NBC_00237]|uniref:TetR/AcrR family transcriptional regulator n=1 Tax=Streptomyces sp. NBC_00237 TaxID=2975687 RepID=UPI00225281AF|nr:TetR/AcrR family transcriptional regulator [Streptomyces sp. NBC_00237]MCX5206642.1 TetR/AcrR family transcriptional regulator [Streptomyces sp. NBC_00237]
MRTNKTPARRPSAVGAVRRRQIIDAAVTVLARDGLSRTSLSRVAEEAGLSSPGLITYHFADKDDVLVQLTEDLLGECVATVEAALQDAPDAMSALLAYIDAFVRFQDRHRDGVRALWRLASSWKAPGRTDAFDARALAGPVEEILRRGVADGEFRELNPAWVAQSVQCSVEGFHELFRADPEVDTDAFVGELQELYRRAVAKGDARQE